MVPELTTAAQDAIAFLTGATLSAMLGQMQWRVDRAAGDLSGYLLLAKAFWFREPFTGILIALVSFVGGIIASTGGW